MAPNRLTPEREAEIRKNWEGTCTDRDELLSEIDALRKELRNEQQFSDNILADVLSSLSLFICTPERGYTDTATLIPLDIERIGKERDALRTENEKLKKFIPTAEKEVWQDAYSEQCEKNLRLRERVEKLRDAGLRLKFVLEGGTPRLPVTPESVVQDFLDALARDEKEREK